MKKEKAKCHHVHVFQYVVNIIVNLQDTIKKRDRFLCFLNNNNNNIQFYLFI
jgi:hypothetical protein